MSNEYWSFEKLSGKAVLRDPFEAEFFTGEEDSEDVYGRTDALVREAIQNSLDASDGNGLVTVRIGICSEEDAVISSIAKGFLKGLPQHLDVLGNESVNLKSEIPPMPYLVVEDFGTFGLRGDPEFNDTEPPDDGKPYDFYWFWRNIGRSGKGGISLGRWGLGKTVFPATSKINAIFGLTIRKDDGRKMLMGQAITKIHRIDETKYVPEGFFCDPNVSEDLQMPFETKKAIDVFQKTFKLKRDSEPGLSIVIPYPFDRIKPQELVRTVIVHYFYPILKGNLKVEIFGPDFDEVELTPETIKQEANNLLWNGSPRDKKHTPPPFDLASWAINCQAHGKITHLKSPINNNSPVWGEHLFEDGQLVQLRDDFSKGTRIAVRVPMTIMKKDKTSENTFFDVFVERDSDLARSDDHFVREGMTISKISTLSSQRGYRGLLVVDDKPLSSLLGDAEGPAHTEWGTGESRPDENYGKWKGRIGFVKNGILKLILLLSPPPKGLDEDWLQDIFAISSPEKEGTKKKRKKKRPKDPPPPPPPPPPHSEKTFEVFECAGGFRIKGIGDPKKVPGRISVKVAYDLPNGNPFKGYSPIDFSFGKKRGRGALTFTKKSVKLEERKENALKIIPKSADFELKVIGFDVNRDVIIRAVAEEKNK